MRHRKSSQQGSVLVVAIFVIVVMGFLATSLVQVQWSNHDTLTRKQLGTQAWLLAHSANEWALTQVYPLTVSPAVSTSVSTVCGNLNSNQVSSGMSTICAVEELTCTPIGILDDVGFFKIESTAVCGSGINQVQRIQEVWVRESIR
ncbi:MSHA biogenesis protein MshP [Vibrio sp. 10N.222.51.C8]|uniref:MSHA biogenesis protein MshP n=1 Tax=unclassified Vibrio TaxID=2614977 RepID=UPI000C84783B|nr:MULTISPECIES: MSHA biogenesis protein MshP [unclassified Vibrio]PMK18036.1 MSHA biogenesis protein MshP [Vibrio sp. 10N.261.54.C3]PMN99290.1 MSHA biogenesis protein MshP [Vibrio sp. 10N.222.55.C12]PMO13761.1 MSHA biogenesis protein MshP [Vibrio sp. 10N.222.54.F10]PMO21569.1 MSHA biogenesis protein MshP [Vibrio sp. 10N.222.54.B6]TKF43848.1 MSHA biogenesis protein MshP [Vibrio sp. F13]